MITWSIFHLLRNFSCIFIGNFKILFKNENWCKNTWIFRSDYVWFGRDLNSVVICYKGTDSSLMLNLWNFKIVCKLFSVSNSDKFIYFIARNCLSKNSRNTIIWADKSILNKLNQKGIKILFTKFIICRHLDSNFLTLTGNISLIIYKNYFKTMSE